MRYNHPIDINNLNDSSAVLYSFVKEGSSVLDVGCACGTLAQILYKKKQCHVSGIEYNTENFAICRKLHIFENLWQIDLNQLKKEQLNNFNQYFDAIILGDVLEHLINPEQVLSLLKDLVKENGRVLISLPNIGHASIKSNLLLGRFDYTEQGILDKTHLRFFTAHSIIAFLTKQNLRINHLKRITMPLDGYQYYKFSKLPKNLVTPEKYLLLVENDALTGKIANVKVGRLFVRNGEVTMETDTITTDRNQTAAFCGEALGGYRPEGFWKTLYLKIIKGHKIQIKEGEILNLKLKKPVRIDLTNGMILE